MALGLVLTGERYAEGSYTSLSLALHAVIGLLMVGTSAYVLVLSLRPSERRVRMASGLSFATILGASVAGATVISGGEDAMPIGPKLVMGALALIGTVLLLAGTGPGGMGRSEVPASPRLPGAEGTEHDDEPDQDDVDVDHRAEGVDVKVGKDPVLHVYCLGTPPLSKDSIQQD